MKNNKREFLDLKQRCIKYIEEMDLYEHESLFCFIESYMDSFRINLPKDKNAFLPEMNRYYKDICNKFKGR